MMMEGGPDAECNRIATATWPGAYISYTAAEKVDPGVRVLGAVQPRLETWEWPSGTLAFTNKLELERPTRFFDENGAPVDEEKKVWIGQTADSPVPGLGPRCSNWKASAEINIAPTMTLQGYPTLDTALSTCNTPHRLLCFQISR
jgi:hypothetical protein